MKHEMNVNGREKPELLQGGDEREKKRWIHNMSTLLTFLPVVICFLFELVRSIFNLQIFVGSTRWWSQI